MTELGTGEMTEETTPPHFVARYEFMADGAYHTIERRDNQGNLLPRGEWCVARWETTGSLANVHYLGADGEWRYKCGTTYTTAAKAWTAYQAARRAACLATEASSPATPPPALDSADEAPEC